MSTDTASPPPGATLYWIDQDGRPCETKDAYLWCWEGGPEWRHVSQHPLPDVAARPRRKGRHAGRGRQVVGGLTGE
jgi:hypothetical protein